MRHVLALLALMLLGMFYGIGDSTLAKKPGSAAPVEVLTSEESSMGDPCHIDLSALPDSYRQMAVRMLSVPVEDRPPLAVCFTPDTDPEVVRRFTEIMAAQSALDYYTNTRWTATATGSTGSQGNPATITYSFVPDGVTIPGSAGEPVAPNTLHATMQARFGSATLWRTKIAQCFARWQELTGVQYVEVSDDGASFPGSGGQFGARGDVRIASHPIDGQYGILAYNFFPNTGDMVLDSGEPWGNSNSDYRFMRNIIMHEHGHGMGISHVCPTNQTKLMEPYLSTSFDGPQHDDMRAGQRNYGDRFENNDTYTAATDLGAPDAGTTAVNNVSTDNAADTDWYRFTVGGNVQVTATITPVGVSYYSDPQNSNGSCPSPFLQLNTLDDQNLDIRLYGPDGTTLIAAANMLPAGAIETLPPTTLAAAGTYFLRVVNGSSGDVVQLYNLALTITPGSGGTITLLSANGGDAWCEQETRAIEWTENGLAGDVCIELNRSYPGSTWEILSTGLPCDAGTFVWTVTTPTTSAARIRITSLNTPTVSDLSDSNFTIVALPPPAAPEALVVTPLPPHIKLNWSPVAEPGIRYQVYRDSSTASPFDIILGTTLDTTFVDSNATQAAAGMQFYLVKSFRP